MARVTALLSWLGTEDSVDVVGIATHHIQQYTFARGLEMSHCRFDEVTGTVQLMPITQVRPALLWLDSREIGIEIAIGLLGACNKTDDLVNFRFQYWIGMSGKTVAGCLKPFGNIRVPEDVWGRLHAWFPV